MKPHLTFALRLTRDILYLADTAPLRWLMAAASVEWARELLIDPLIFERPIYRLMSAMAEIPLQVLHLDRLGITPQHVWSVAFLCYAGGVFWRIYEGQSRRYWGLAVNMGGAVLWFGSTLMMTLAVGNHSPAMVLEWAFSLQLILVAVRTALNDSVTSP